MPDPQQPTSDAGSASARVADLPFLGHARAVSIVCECANTSASNLARSLAQLGVNGIPFQKCVFAAVEAAGYDIRIDDIPDSQDTTLFAAAAAIQTAARKA
jgi:hypothetical protein